VVGVLSLHSTDKAGPETWEVKRADGERAGYSRDRVGTSTNTCKNKNIKLYYKVKRRCIMQYLS